MSETKENCPECGHSIYSHQAKCFQMVDVTTDYLSCSCTRTYKSFVGDDNVTNTYLFDCCECRKPSWGYVGQVACDDCVAVKASFAKPELQLLVIDMGDTCVVKVEKGQVILKNLCIPSMVIYDGQVQIVNVPFTKLREAIDQKPVPRIERDLNDPEDFALVQNHRTNRIDGQMYKVLSELAGKPLPIWEGGKWEELIGLQKEGDAGWLDAKILTIWRYTR